MDDWQLIESYTERQSEAAFKALVERHAGLVYASALRQVRDPHLAQDIAQAVFVLLARKAASLRQGTVLSGWLFQTTRFVASRAIRSEQRRQRREQEALEMQQINSADTAWRRMEPVIDDALDHLGRKDRDAVLLRYLDGRSMRDIGTALGITEEAAKKRVTRAVEKLRAALTGRGVSLSAPLIASALAVGGKAAIPGTVLAAIKTTAGTTALSGLTGGWVSEATVAWRWAKVKLALGSIGLGTALVIGTFMAVKPGRQPAQNAASIAAPQTMASMPHPQELAPSNRTASSHGKVRSRMLQLRAVDAATGDGIPHARVACCVWSGQTVEDRWDLVADGSGNCEVPYTLGIGRLDVGVLVDGWAARFATWPSEGSAEIPDAHTLALERVTNRIGGRIFDSLGRPVALAEVWFQAGGTGDSAHRERPRERFGFIHAAPVNRTDSQGRWSLGFIPPRHPGFQLYARHPNFAQTPVIRSDPQDPAAVLEREDLKQLWAGELVTTMQTAFTLRGMVIDGHGAPIAGATVQQSRESEVFTTDHTGAFSVLGLGAGTWHFTTTAEGFAPVRTNAPIGPAMGTIVVTLQPGAVLRLRVVDEQGAAVPDATVGLERWGEHRDALEWRATTEWDGRLEWRAAPSDVTLELYACKHGFCYTRDVKLSADGEEHVIVLRHALEVHGRVVDAQTGEGIPDFKVVPGYGDSQRFYNSELRWFSGETVRGTNGAFKLTFTENQLPWQLRLVADGSEDWTSGSLETNQSPVTLDIALQRSAVEDSVRGLVLKPDGTPASAAQVALLSLEHNVRLLRNATFEGNQRWLTRAGENGAFRFPVNRAAHSLAAASPDGYAHMRLRQPQAQVTLQLQPWGRVEGAVDASARTLPLESIELYDPAADNYQGRVSLLGEYTTKPDPSGRFTFERVPAGQFSVFINSLGGIPYHHQTSLTVTPGETTEVLIIEQPGALLKGRFIAPPGKEMDWKKDLVLGRLELDSLRSPAGWPTRDERTLAALEFWTSDTGRAFVNARRMVSLCVDDDGSFISVERVPAGEYRFVAIFKAASMTRKLVVSTADEQLPFVDLGQLEL